MKYEYMTKYGYEPTFQDYADELGITVEKAAELLKAEDVVSLNATVANSDGKEETELGEFIEDKRNIDDIFGDKVTRDEFRRVVFNSSFFKSEREKEVIMLRFGFIDGKIWTLEEIGKKYGLTRERIRQIETRTIRRLLRDSNIRSFAPDSMIIKNDEVPSYRTVLKYAIDERPNYVRVLR